MLVAGLSQHGVRVDKGLLLICIDWVADTQSRTFLGDLMNRVRI